MPNNPAPLTRVVRIHILITFHLNFTKDRYTQYMEGNRVEGIPIVTSEVVGAALRRNAYSREDLHWINNKLSLIEPNLSDYIWRNTVDVLSENFGFALGYGITGGFGKRRERRIAQNIVLHTVALLADQAGYNKTGKFNTLALDELLPVYSMRKDIFAVLSREKEEEKKYQTARLSITERLTRINNPLLAEEIDQMSGYGTRWQRWSERIVPRVRRFQAGYITTYGVLAAISLQARSLG